MNVTVTLFGKSYRRKYEQRFCALPGCGKRIPFRVMPDGTPERSDKQAKRVTCCPEHFREWHAMQLRERARQARESGVAAPDLFDVAQAWLCGRRVSGVG